MKIYRGIPATSEHDASAQDQIARALIQLGESLAEDPRQRKRARDCFDEALFLLVPLASKFADYTAFRRDQVAGFTGRSRVYIALGSLENAKQDCEAGRALLDGLTTGRRNADYEILRAQSLEVEARIKDLTGARDAAQELRRLAENVLQYALTLDKERAPDRRLLERLRGATSAKAAALP